MDLILFACLSPDIGQISVGLRQVLEVRFGFGFRFTAVVLDDFLQSVTNFNSHALCVTKYRKESLEVFANSEDLTA
jgi:hypothetical protein